MVYHRVVCSDRLFLFYTACVITLARCHDIGVQSYADDTQLYIHSEAKMCVASIPRLVSCIDNINRWMLSNRFKLNSDKTDIIQRELSNLQR